ncbi:MAG: phospholipase D-like domain-containing protein, partial [Thermoguttaceae bacterium]
YVDVRVKMLESMFHKRSKGYADLGYKTTVCEDREEKTGVLFDEKNFFPIFAQDIAMAQSEIIIVSPFMRKGRVGNMINLLLRPLADSVKIGIITRPPECCRNDDIAGIREMSESLRQQGISVHTQDAIHQKFAVIDKRIVWYGSLNFLAYGASSETLMRFENRSLADELLETVH